jgi:GNAT superfamily N-acetyltransferase
MRRASTKRHPTIVPRVQVIVEAVPASVTFPLRQQDLRPHESFERLALPGDDDPDSCHLAARTAHRRVVGTATVRREAPPWEPATRTAWRLRGMATSEGLRGQGIGTQVLDAVITHVASRGGGLLWCNARTPAIAFYERAGFLTRGERWMDPNIGPHVAMWRNVEMLSEPGVGG